MTKPTNEEFILKLKNIFGDKYDYSKIDYKDEHIKVKLICPIHGEFEKNPYKLLRGEGCQKCAFKGINSNQHHEKAKYSEEKTKEFIRKAEEVHGKKYDYSETKYVNATSKVEIICLEHGPFLQTPNSHLSGHGCPACNYGKARGKTLSKEDFIKKAKEIHEDKYDYSKIKYVNTSTKIEIVCPVHGSFWQTPRRHIYFKCGCPKCNHKNISKEEFIERANKIYNNKYDYSKIIYKDFRISKVEIVCPVHGSFWQIPAEHLRHNCPKCSRENVAHSPKNEEQFIKEAKEKFPDYDYKNIDYKNNYTKIKLICPIHGEFFKYPYAVLNGSGCPKCMESKGERSIRAILEEKKLDFKQEYIFENCKNKGSLRFDFYLPTLNIVIEYQGEQHYHPVEVFGGEEKFKEQVINDNIKREFCLKNNIKELEIKYSDSIEEKLKDL